MIDNLQETLEKNKDKYKINKPFSHIRLKNLFPDKLLDDVVDNIFNIKDEYKWLKLCTTGKDFSEFGESAVELINYLTSDQWVSFLSELTGVENLRSDKSWHGSGINFEPRGSHLEPHTDFNRGDETTQQMVKSKDLEKGGFSRNKIKPQVIKNIAGKNIGWRRVNVLLFLTKNWRKKWGGYNELGQFEDKEYRKIKSYKPEFNTMVIFNTSPISFHGFGVVRCPEDSARIVISCYYYTNDKGPHRSHSDTTNYVGWDKERNMDIEYNQRSGTGWKELK